MTLVFAAATNPVTNVAVRVLTGLGKNIKIHARQRSPTRIPMHMVQHTFTPLFLAC
jgi:hypothetical protein